MTKYKLEELKTAEEVHLERFQSDPEYRAEWERSALARAVSELICIYRAQHNLTQAQFAKKSGLEESYVDRLEAGEEYNPDLETLVCLAEVLDIELIIDITPSKKERKGITKIARDSVISKSIVGHSEFVIAAV